jgi:hypothetical protein
MGDAAHTHRSAQAFRPSLTAGFARILSCRYVLSAGQRDLRQETQGIPARPRARGTEAASSTAPPSPQGHPLHEEVRTFRLESVLDCRAASHALHARRVPSLPPGSEDTPAQHTFPLHHSAPRAPGRFLHVRARRGSRIRWPPPNPPRPRRPGTPGTRDHLNRCSSAEAGAAPRKAAGHSDQSYRRGNR